MIELFLGVLSSRNGASRTDQLRASVETRLDFDSRETRTGSRSEGTGTRRRKQGQVERTESAQKGDATNAVRPGLLLKNKTAFDRSGF